MGFGTGSYGFSPIGVPAPPPLGQNNSDLSSSRKIDGVTKRYVLDAIGGFEPMDDTDQRVLLLISFADVETKFITPADLKKQEANIRGALSILTDGRSPAIQLISVSCVRSGPGQTQKTIVYKNLLTDTQQTVKASS